MPKKHASHNPFDHKTAVSKPQKKNKGQAEDISEEEWRVREIVVEQRARASGCLLIGFVVVFVISVYAIFSFTRELWIASGN